ncbi:MAG: ATP-binding cassette domain-containing protein [Gemmatimonadota bacterium]
MTSQSAAPAAATRMTTPGGLLLRLLRRGRGWAALLVLAALTGAAAEMLLPAAIGGAVDSLPGLAGGQATRQAPWGALARAAGVPAAAGPAAWVAVIAALAAAAAGCGAFSQLATGASTASATAWLRHRLIRQMLACGPALTRRFPPGDVASRVIGGAAEAGGAAAGAALAAAAVIPPLGSIVALLLIDPWLALALAAGGPALAWMLRRFLLDTSDTVTRYQQAQGAIAARLLEALAGARTIAAAGTAAAEVRRILAPLPHLRAQGERTWRILGRASAQSTLLVPLLQVLVLAAGGLELAAHRITPGELIAASQYALLGAGAGAAIDQLNRLARARAGAARAADLLAVPAPGYGARTLPAGPGSVEFRGVTARADGEVILDRIDLAVPGGAAVAIVGPSGAGKSVLTALAGRLADPDEGQVLLDGVPLPELAQAELRRAVQFAFARPALLGQTVGDAIGFGDPPARLAQAVAGARAARADDFIRRLPEGYGTALAQAPLSGGEAQRLGLARAFARSPGARLLILDDATSSLDTVTEMQVSQALTGEFGGLTRFIAAHRASTAARADLVAWLDRGRLRACAPHGELWADPGYRAVFSSGTGPAPASGAGPAPGNGAGPASGNGTAPASGNGTAPASGKGAGP